MRDVRGHQVTVARPQLPPAPVQLGLEAARLHVADLPVRVAVQVAHGALAKSDADQHEMRVVDEHLARDAFRDFLDRRLLRTDEPRLFRHALHQDY